MTDSNDSPFDNISKSDLPDGWEMEQRYENAFVLNSPQGNVAHVLINRYDDEDTLDYEVIPMIPTSLDGAFSKNDGEHQEVFKFLENAVPYAVSQAHRLDRMYPTN